MTRSQGYYTLEGAGHAMNVVFSAYLDDANSPHDENFSTWVPNLNGCGEVCTNTSLVCSSLQHIVDCCSSLWLSSHRCALQDTL